MAAELVSMPPVTSEWQFNCGTTEQPRWMPFGAEAQHKLEAAFEEVPKSKHLTVKSGDARYWINFDGPTPAAPTRRVGAGSDARVQRPLQPGRSVEGVVEGPVV